MMWENLSSVLISTAVIAATLAAITNVIVALMNNARLRSDSRKKHKNELMQYRCMKLYSILEDIEREHGFINYVGDNDRTFTETFPKRERFVELYNLARLLIEGKIRKSLDNAATSEHDEFSYVKDEILKSKPVSNSDVWLAKLNVFHDTLRKAIQEQIINLLES